MTALLLAAAALAGPLDTWGAGEIGFAGNAGVAAHTPHAAWYNPANMRTRHLAAGAELVGGDVRFKLDGEDIVDVRSTPGVLVGATTNLQWLGLKWAHLGFVAVVPFAGPFTWDDQPIPVHSDVPPTPQVPRWSSDLARVDAAFAANVNIGWLGFGAGVDVAARFETTTWVVLQDLEDSSTATKNQDVRIGPTLHPFFGATVDLTPTARLGLVIRAPRKMRDFGVTHVTIFGGDFLYRHDFVRHYAPWTFTLGGDIHPAAWLSLRAEISYEVWSRAPDPYDGELGWRDTVTTRVGAAIDIGRVRLLAGGGLDPTPARQIPEGTLHVDARSIAGTAGVSVRVTKARDGRPVRIVGGGRYQGFFEDLDGHRVSGRIVGGRIGVVVGP